MRLAAVALPIAAIIGAAAFFPHAGNYLTVNEPLEKAEVVYALAGAHERWLEAVDLYRDGWAGHIVLSPGYEDKSLQHLWTRGVKFPTDMQLVADAIRQLHVPPEAVSVLPHEVDNTAQEAVAIAQLCQQHGWTRLIVVTSRYHARRARLAIRREFEGTSVRIIVRTSRHDGATPEKWWKNRADVRYVLSEYQKLLLYAFGLRG